MHVVRKKSKPTLHGVPDVVGHFQEDADESGAKLCRQKTGMFQAREGDGQDRPVGPFWTMFKGTPSIYSGRQAKNFDEMVATRKSPLQVRMCWHTVCIGVQEKSVAQQSFDAFKCTSSMELLFHQASQPAQWCSFPNPAQPIDDQGWIVRSPEALRPLTLWQMRMQGSHGCTWLPFPAVLHFLRSPAFSRLKQRPFSYPCANHSRIFRVTQRAGLASILQTLLRRIFNEGTSAVEHASQVRGHFALAGGVWPGCLASAFFFFTTAKGPIFRWLNDEIFARDRSFP